MEKNVDIRVIKTQRAIRNAFLELMNEIGFSKITVQKILDLAEINRSTFYSYYTDKFDLLDKIENDLLKGLIELTNELPSDYIITESPNMEALLPFFNQIVNYMYENGRTFTLLMSDKGDPAFVNKLGDVVSSNWKKKNLLDRLTIPQSYALAAVIGMMTSLISEWVKNDFRETPEEFLKIISKIGKDLPKNIFS